MATVIPGAIVRITSGVPTTMWAMAMQDPVNITVISVGKTSARLPGSLLYNHETVFTISKVIRKLPTPCVNADTSGEALDAFAVD